MKLRVAMIRTRSFVNVSALLEVWSSNKNLPGSGGATILDVPVEIEFLNSASECVIDDADVVYLVYDCSELTHSLSNIDVRFIHLLRRTNKDCQIVLFGLNLNLIGQFKPLDSDEDSVSSGSVESERDFLLEVVDTDAEIHLWESSLHDFLVTFHLDQLLDEPSFANRLFHDACYIEDGRSAISTNCFRMLQIVLERCVRRRLVKSHLNEGIPIVPIISKPRGVEFLCHMALCRY
jgi:hypothetical protein